MSPISTITRPLRAKAQRFAAQRSHLHAPDYRLQHGVALASRAENTNHATTPRLMKILDPDALTAGQYDAAPYPDEAYRDGFVQRAATMALLHGITPPPIERCRVLDIGCAGAEHLLAMASMLPQSEFVGIDVSPVQVQNARDAKLRIGLKNVRIECASLKELDGAWGQFDYIIAHGVYSWISPELQVALLDACRERLSEKGVAYVSYNTYPGWHAASAIRSLMRYASRGADTPQEAMKRARSMLQFVKEAALALPDTDRVSTAALYRTSLAEDLMDAQGHDDHYLVHEHLSPYNEPLYFHEFVKRTQEAGLRYLSDAHLHAKACPDLVAGLQAGFDRIPTERVEREQYLDFIVGRRFRKSLLVKASCNVAPEPSLAAADRLFLAAELSRSHWHGDGPERRGSFEMADATTLAPDSALTCAVLEVANEHWPLGVRLDAAFDLARGRLGYENTSADWAAERARAEVELLNAFRRYQISLLPAQPNITAHVQDHPGANPWIRDRVRRHLDIMRMNDHRQLSEPSVVWSSLLRRLDGRTTHAGLAKSILREIDREKTPGIDAEEQADRSKREQEMIGKVRFVLRQLAHHGLLVDSTAEAASCGDNHAEVNGCISSPVEFAHSTV